MLGLMKRIAFTILLIGFVLNCRSETYHVMEVELQDNESSRLLTAFYKAKDQMDLNRMDSLWNLISEPERHFSQDQLALKNFSFGWFYYFNDLYDEALKYFNETYKLAKENNHRQLELYAKASIGNVEYSYKNVKVAINIFQEVLDSTLEQDWKLRANMLGNIAPLQNELAETLELSEEEKENYYKLSDENYKKSLAILERHNDWESLARVYSVYSQVAFELGRVNDAKSYLEKASKSALRSGSRHKYHFTLIKWGQYLYSTGDYEAGIDSLLKAVDYFKKVNYKEAIHNSSTVLSHAYAQNKQYDSAYKLMNEMIIYKWRMNVEKMSRQSKLYRVELEVYEKENKIQEQARKIELQYLENQLTEANRKRWIIGGISAVIITLLLSMVFIQNIKQRAKVEKSNLLIAEREQAFRSVIEGQEAERKRIAQELHDGIGQQLSGIKMALNNVVENIKEQKDESHSQLKMVIDLVGVSSSEVRQLAHQMLPQVLEEKGLSEALKDLIQSTFNSTRIKFNYDYQLESTSLSKDWKLTIYRSIQELINNTIKHSGASEIDLYLYKSGLNLLVAYSDNGSGLDELTLKKGLGLTGIKHRIENLKGSFTIDFSTNKGFNAIFKIPLV